MLLTVAACAGSSFAEDLDASLAVQKKTAQHRVYSDRALLDNQKMEVPRTPSEEELALDKKLQAMEEKAARSASTMRSAVPAPITVERSVQQKNWLVPAQMENPSGPEMTNEAGEAWLLREIDRQKTLKEQEAAAAEKADLSDKLKRGKKQQPEGLPTLDRLKEYQLAPQKMSGEKNPDSSSYKMPLGGSTDPLAAVRPQKSEPPAAAPLFSPAAARTESGIIKNPFTPAASKPALNPYLGSTAPKVRSGVSSGLNQPETAPLPPLQAIRKASPINQADPFATDHMPQMKRNIWE